ncbi:MAG: FIST N-terminal domain-containing protein [Nannocystaceae bacterium]|nr:FIST C-terminal domain-containing protein [bacterium]
MHTFEGSSQLTDGAAAVQEAVEHWSEAPEMLFVFCSAAQDASSVANALSHRFPGVPMVGCSTSGEHIGGKHHRNSLVVAGLCDTGIDWAVQSFEGLADFDEARGDAAAHHLFEQHGADPETLDPEQFLALLFVDGLSMSEERVSSALAAGLQGVPLAGGSAGDDLAFSKTTVICNGTAKSDRAAVVLARSTEAQFHVIKHQHFTTEKHMLAVTKADPAARRVYEFDGYPAAEAYAKAIGVPLAELDGAKSFLHPVMFRCEGENYVRSIQSVNDDGSLTFYCAMEEGMVLQTGSHHDMTQSLHGDLSPLKDVDFMLGFNCVLRALEASGDEKWDELGAEISAVAKSSIGFDTYGEQLNGLHINQTLVAVAFSSKSKAVAA